MKSSPLTLLLPGISQLTTALRGTFIQGFDSDNQDVRRGEGIDEFYVADGLFYGIDTVCRGQTFDTGDPMGLKAAADRGVGQRILHRGRPSDLHLG